MTVPSSLPTSMTGTFGSSHSVPLTLLPWSLLPPVQSILSSSPPSFRCGEHHAQTPFLPELIEMVKPTLSCLGGHLHIQETASPVPWSSVNEPPWTRPHADSVTSQALWLNSTLQASTRRPSMTFSLCTLVLLANMCSRISFVSEDEAKTFDTEVVGFWSQLIQSRRHITSVQRAPQTWRPQVLVLN